MVREVHMGRPEIKVNVTGVLGGREVTVPKTRNVGKGRPWVPLSHLK